MLLVTAYNRLNECFNISISKKSMISELLDIKLAMDVFFSPSRKKMNFGFLLQMLTYLLYLMIKQNYMAKFV